MTVIVLHQNLDFTYCVSEQHDYCVYVQLPISTYENSFIHIYCSCWPLHFDFHSTVSQLFMHDRYIVLLVLDDWRTVFMWVVIIAKNYQEITDAQYMNLTFQHYYSTMKEPAHSHNADPNCLFCPYPYTTTINCNSLTRNPIQSTTLYSNPKSDHSHNPKPLTLTLNHAKLLA